jgi:hypothetical protein
LSLSRREKIWNMFVVNVRHQGRLPGHRPWSAERKEKKRPLFRGHPISFINGLLMERRDIVQAFFPGHH